ncbi:MAG: TonB-dependent receptor [Acidobacteria bacterium]|nr:TonB-dependent receptor [Acidobacteriota bacterium]
MTILGIRPRAALVLLACAALLVGALFTPKPARAQVLYGGLVGTVRDAQGAVVPGVTVVITNVGTGLRLETVTDDAGSYVFRNLLPGTFDMTLTMTGFKELRRTGIVVAVGTPRRQDVTLEVGAPTETVTVSAEVIALQTETSDVTAELTGQQMISLPLNQYRNYQTLLNLVPGATPVQFQNAEIDTPQRSLRTWVNGVQPNTNTTRVDGAVSINVWLPHHAGYVTPTESIETVNVSTNSFEADTGFAAGAAQTVITKSGTNDLKGSAFWFMNSDSLNANSFYNNAFKIARPERNLDIFGGTLGGPILKDKLFYFGSYEMFRDRRPATYTYAVPTEKMKAGDFSEVAAARSNFRLYDPDTGNPDGSGRTQFPNFTVPGNRIDAIAKKIMALYPKVNTDKDLNSNGLLDDYMLGRPGVEVDRHHFDTKITWQRSASHSIWGKYSMMKANVVDNYNLGWEEGSNGDTDVYVVGLGHTWTLGPTLLLDGNFGYYRQDQVVLGPDYGKNYGLELGIPGTNDPNDVRASGMPTIANGYTIGGTPSWMPLWRKELNYSFSSALTKVFPRHEVKTGLQVVKLELDHRQAEWGPYGLKGGLSFSGNITGAPGYAAQAWNQFAAFLLGRADYFSKDTQTEVMTGREWQWGLFLSDRWRATQKLTLNLGMRLEAYPLMSRADRGLERLEYDTYTVLIGGLGGVPKDVGLKVQTWYFSPRVGAAYRITEKNVLRAGYSQTFNALPWSRPLRGSFPQDINFNRTADQFWWTTTLAQGIPPVVLPDISSGRVKLPAGVYIRSPNIGVEYFPGSGKGLDRATIHQYNFTFERELPGKIVTGIAYVGTRTNGGYADLNLNYGEPGGGNAARKYYAVAGTTSINDWAARTKTRYHGLQVEVNRGFSEGLMLKGAYTLGRAKDMADEDGWTGLTWNHPMKYEDNFALGGFDRTHNFQMGFVYELPFLRTDTSAKGIVLGGWQLNGIFAKYSGTPYSIGGSNTALNCQGCGSILINVSGDPEPIGKVGSGSRDRYYDVSLFSQPTGTGKDGFGTSLRNHFRRPPVWNLDLSMFKIFKVTERFRPEFRIEAANVFNHTNWGAPNTTFTDTTNFLTFAPGNAESGTNTPGARRVQIGLRVAF